MLGNAVIDNPDPDRTSPLTASITRRLEAMIRANQFRPGSGLPSERQLAADFEVSRGIVRAAIKNLTEMGLLESKRNCRPVVRVPLKTNGTTTGRHVGIW